MPAADDELASYWQRPRHVAPPLAKRPVPQSHTSTSCPTRPRSTAPSPRLRVDGLPPCAKMEPSAPASHEAEGGLRRAASMAGVIDWRVVTVTLRVSVPVSLSLSICMDESPGSAESTRLGADGPVRYPGCSSEGYRTIHLLHAQPDASPRARGLGWRLRARAPGPCRSGARAAARAPRARAEIRRAPPRQKSTLYVSYILYSVFRPLFDQHRVHATAHASPGTRMRMSSV